MVPQLKSKVDTQNDAMFERRYLLQTVIKMVFLLSFQFDVKLFR